MQTGHAVADRIARGEHQHRQVQPVLAQAAQQFDAVLVGQAEVEHQHVESGRAQQCFGRRGAGHVIDGQPLGAEAGDDAAGDQFIVFGEQYVHAWIRAKNQVSTLAIKAALCSRGEALMAR